MGLLGEDHAVPGEVDVLGDFTARCETEFGGAAADGIVGVAPGDPVRGGDGNQPVVAVPRITPGAGLAGQSAGVPGSDSALSIVLVADVAGRAEQSAGVDARTHRC